MKKNFIKPLSFIVCLVLLISTISIGAAYAFEGNDKDGSSETNENSIIIPENKDKIKKDETVYVMTDMDGKVKKIIVSDWIKNTIGASSVNDKSDLDNVENVKGDETYTMNGDDMRVWDAEGKDIYYQGNIEKELPVNMAVSYKLNGEQISAQELAGKSGKVTIRFDFKNNQYQTVEIDGKKEKIFVPFAMISGMIFDSKIFENVEITNGKLINDGDRIIAAGIAFPGLLDNFKISSDEHHILDHIEITADVKNFEMSNTVTIASNELFGKIDTDKIDLTDALSGLTDQLTSAVDQLLDGSSALYDGLCTLLEKSDTLIDGIDKLVAGSKKLKAGTNKLESGVNQLDEGALELNEGLKELEANNKALNDGAKEIFESLLNMAGGQLKAAGLTVPKLTIENYSKVLDNLILSLSKENVEKKANEQALSIVTQKVNAQKDRIKAAVTAVVREKVTYMVETAVRGNVKTQVLAQLGMTVEQYEQGIKAGRISEEEQKRIETAVDREMTSDNIKALIDENVKENMKSEKVKATIEQETEKQIDALIKENMKSDEVQTKIKTALMQAEAGRNQISGLKTQLDSVNEFYSGLKKYTSGVSTAKDGTDELVFGTNELKNGTAELQAGVDELCSGVLEMQNGTPALKQGVTDLRDGAMQLSDGFKEFDESAVEKLVDIFNGDIKDLIVRIKATADVSREYKSFSGISDDMDGKVKFVYRTDSIVVNK